MWISKEGRSGWQEQQWVGHAVVTTAAAIQHVFMLRFEGVNFASI